MAREALRRIKNTEKRPIVVAILVFVLTTVTIVVVNSYLLGKFMPNYSISRYVGSETWSAIGFMMANLVVAMMVLKYLYMVGEKWGFGRGYFWVVVMMAIGLIGLSACPIGYFDVVGYATSAPSHVHEICSRLMFVCMLVVATMILVCKPAVVATRLVAAVYTAYGVVCVFGYMTGAQWFVSHVLLFESCYIFGFLAFCLGLQGREIDVLPRPIGARNNGEKER